MQENEILDRFNTELQQVHASGGLDATLRWTGEQLALAGERLRTADAGSRTARAAELLVIAGSHVDALAAAGMDGDALATQAMALLTVIMSKVNPEEFPSLYLQCLQALCLRASAFLYTVQPADTMQASQIVSQTFGLFIATAHAYMPRFGASDDMRRFYDRLRHMAAQAGEDVSHFRGHLIVPTLAADILADNLSRLSALGVGVGDGAQ